MKLPKLPTVAATLVLLALSTAGSAAARKTPSRPPHSVSAAATPTSSWWQRLLSLWTVATDHATDPLPPAPVGLKAQTGSCVDPNGRIVPCNPPW